MEDAQKIFNYLPLTPPDDEYIRFLWESFEVNYKNEKYQFSFIAYHMLFMCFVYYQIAKLCKTKSAECRDLMLFTGKVQDHIDNYEQKISSGEEALLAPLQKFSQENERTIMGLFLAIHCSREEIKRFKKIVDYRNDVAHSNGNIFFKNKEGLDMQIDEILSCMEIIQEKSKVIVVKAYTDFLFSSSNPDDREFYDNKDQVDEILIRENYLSPKDVSIALTLDASSFKEDDRYANILSLNETLNQLLENNE